MFGQHRNGSILLVCAAVHSLMASVGNSRIEQVLSEAELERANRFQFPILRDQFVAGRYFLRQLLGYELGIEAAEVEFSKGANGKPVIANRQKLDLQFSFSRSDRFAVVGVTRGSRIGVDVELIRKIPDMDLVAREIFSRLQLEQWQSISESERELAFLRSWTRKEAIAKVDGRGISNGVQNIDVPIGDLNGFAATVSCPVDSKRPGDSVHVACLSEWHPTGETIVNVAIESDTSVAGRLDFSYRDEEAQFDRKFDVETMATVRRFFLEG